MAHRLRRYLRARAVGWLVAGLTAFLLSLLLPLPKTAGETAAVVSTRITDRNGQLLREVRPEGRGMPIGIGSISAEIAEALVATEDRFFYRHPGINPLALLRAAVQSLRRRSIVSGGSTITMQVARSLRGRSRHPLVDKLAEMHLALRLELRMSKREILALWLNRAPFGNQAYGIEAASRTYFGKSAADLSLAEATFLIGLPHSPSRYDPSRHPERALARHRRVIHALVRHGLLSEEDGGALAALRPDLVPPDRTFRAPHFTSWIVRQLSSVEDDVREVRTTLDGQLQEVVEAIVAGHLRELRRQDVSSAAVIVLHNRTGEVLAYVGSADFWDERNGGQNDGVRMKRQPGSALKPFTYAHAFSTRRYAPATIVPDIETLVPEAGGAFSPQNYDRRFRGPVPAREALAGSYNVPAVRLTREFGPEALLATYRRAGFETLDGPADFYGVGLTLGNGEVRLIDLARAYAGLALGGERPTVRPIQYVLHHDGRSVPAAGARYQPSGISPDVAFLITDVLRDPEARSAAFGRGGSLELPFPVAAKTGTTKDYRDNWAIGYSSTHTVAVWVGNFDGRPMRWVSGVSGAAPIMKSIFLAIGPGGDFARPAGIEEAQVCPASGSMPGSACPSRRTEIFLRGTVPTDSCGVHRRIRIDSRTGLLADASTPAIDVVHQTFALHPPEYDAWMMEQGLPLPPPISASGFTDRSAASSDDVMYSDKLTVTYPETGAVFQIDPVLRTDFQRLHLRGTHAYGVTALQWWVDGRPLEASFLEASVPLREGRHQIELRGLTGDGRVVRSRPSVIHVVAPRTTISSLPASHAD